MAFKESLNNVLKHSQASEVRITLTVAGDQLTGTAKNDNGESKITEGKVSGDDVTFVEMLKFQEMEIRIVYKGKVSGDQIKFTRQVGDFGSEEFTAKRTK